MATRALSKSGGAGYYRGGFELAMFGYWKMLESILKKSSNQVPFPIGKEATL